MTKTQALLCSLHQFTNQRRALKATEHRLDTEQRKVMDKLSRALGQVEFRIVPVTPQHIQSDRTLADLACCL